MAEDFSKGAAWMRGEVIPIAQATIGVNDWALTHSDVTYDVVPVWDGAFFRLGDYLERFAESIKSCRMDIGMTSKEVQAALTEMVGRSGLYHAYVAMVAARGVPLIPGSRDPRDCANHFYAWCVPYIHVVKPEVVAKGAELWISKDVQRIPDSSVNQRTKNYHWGDFTQGLFEAKDRGYESVVLLDHEGNLAEGPGFNIFALKGDTVVTPDRHVLHGITRRTALEMASAEGLKTEERPLPLAEFLEADEIFMSTSGGGIVPVVKAGERIFSNGTPGPMATRLRERYFELLCEPSHRTEISYVRSR